MPGGHGDPAGDRASIAHSTPCDAEWGGAAGWHRYRRKLCPAWQTQLMIDEKALTQARQRLLAAEGSMGLALELPRS